MSDEDRLLQTLALMEALEHMIAEMGHDQLMSTGPVLARLSQLRNRHVRHAKGYGVVDEDVTRTELRARAADKYNVELNDD